MNTATQESAESGTETLPTGSQRGGNDVQTPFLKLSDDGDAVIVALLGRLHIHEVFWDGKKYQLCSEVSTPRSAACQTRVAINVAVCEIIRLNREPSMRISEVRVWEHSHKVFRQMCTLTRTFRTGEWLFLIERQGKPMSKATSYAILPVYALDNQERQALKSLELFDLNQIYGADTRGKSKSEGERIDPPSLELLNGEFSKLPDPDTAIREFCSHFEIHRIDQLPKEDVPEARNYLARLNNNQGNPFE